MFSRVEGIGAAVQDVLDGAEREEIQALHVVLMIYCGVAQERAEKLREAPEPASAPEMLTCRQVADELALHEETVRVLCRHKELVSVRIGRAIRISRAELDRYRKNHCDS